MGLVIYTRTRFEVCDHWHLLLTPTYVYADRKNPDSERIYFRVGYASKLSRRTHWENDCPSKEPIVCGYWPWPEQDNDADVMAPRPQGRFCHRVKKFVSLELADLVVNKQHLDLKFPEVEKTSDAIEAVSPGLESRKSPVGKARRLRRKCTDCELRVRFKKFFVLCLVERRNNDRRSRTPGYFPACSRRTRKIQRQGMGTNSKTYS